MWKFGMIEEYYGAAGVLAVGVRRLSEQVSEGGAARPEDRCASGCDPTEITFGRCSRGLLHSETVDAANSWIGGRQAWLVELVVLAGPGWISLHKHAMQSMNWRIWSPYVPRGGEAGRWL